MLPLNLIFCKNPQFLPINSFKRLASQSIKTPESRMIFKYPAWSMEYDAKRKNPSWVYEILTPRCFTANPISPSKKFYEDTRIPSLLRSSLTDYKQSGYDRGHIACASNHKYDPISYKNTFALSNISPQHPQFNQGYWSKVEKLVQYLALKNKRIDVISGPLYLPFKTKDGKKYVKYEVIGKKNVAVPTHFFKVIFIKKKVLAMIFPNQPIPFETPLKNFKVSLKKFGV